MGEASGTALRPPPASPTCSVLAEGRLELTAACNAACSCRPEHYSPVCGSDSLLYYSPCHAGCLGVAAPGPGGQKVSAAPARAPSVRALDPGRAPAPSSCNSAVVALLRCTKTVGVSFRIFPLVLAMLPQGNAPQLA